MAVVSNPSFVCRTRHVSLLTDIKEGRVCLEVFVLGLEAYLVTRVLFCILAFSFLFLFWAANVYALYTFERREVRTRTRTRISALQILRFVVYLGRRSGSGKAG